MQYHMIVLPFGKEAPPLAHPRGALLSWHYKNEFSKSRPVQKHPTYPSPSPLDYRDYRE
eukprot:SAG22_NODE_20186_length_267_cov_2.148810_1_plen_58_part_10